MEIRVLRYFISVVREESITRAAQVLHITQPTLSRQMAQMEDEMGVKLFVRGKRKIALTNEGLLLFRRAEEILELVDKTEKELTAQEANVEGMVSVGCGDIAAVQLLPALIREFNAKYPKVNFNFYTATADMIMQRMDRGLTDVGLLMEPLSMERCDFIRLSNAEQWVVAMHPDSPLAKKGAITAEDLRHEPLIMPHRLTIQAELANWFGDAYSQLHVLFYSNLPSTACVMVGGQLAYALIVKGSTSFWDQQRIVLRPLSPDLTASSVLVWKAQQPFGVATEKFIEFAKDYFSRNPCP